MRPNRPVPHGRFQLLHWVGHWVNEGEDHGRGCRFATRADAEAWARYENEHNYGGAARFALIELPLPLPPVGCGTEAADGGAGAVCGERGVLCPDCAAR